MTRARVFKTPNPHSITAAAPGTLLAQGLIELQVARDNSSRSAQSGQSATGLVQRIGIWPNGRIWSEWRCVVVHIARSFAFLTWAGQRSARPREHSASSNLNDSLLPIQCWVALVQIPTPHGRRAIGKTIQPKTQQRPSNLRSVVVLVFSGPLALPPEQGLVHSASGDSTKPMAFPEYLLPVGILPLADSG